jgi:hypothetical protein
VSGSLLVRGLVRRLEGASYKVLPTPFNVASVDFEFTAAMLGSEGRGLDLILIVDTATGEFGDRDPATVQLRVEALSRALDITRSRYLLTVVLLGAALPNLVEQLSPTCRVLTVEEAALDAEGQPTSAIAAEAFDDHIRVLLPLDVRPDDDVQDDSRGDPIGELLATLPATLDSGLVRGLAEASARGEDAVTKALGKRLAEVLVLEQPA